MMAIFARAWQMVRVGSGHRFRIGIRRCARSRLRWSRRVVDESLSEWLAYREPADWASRSVLLVDRVMQAIRSTETLRVLDLCTGTGSNLRYLIGRLPARQKWLVVDRDARLLEEVPSRLRTW